MLVVPPAIPQAEQENKKAPNNIVPTLEANEIITNPEQLPTNKSASIVSQNPPEEKHIIIRKKRQYKAFLKLLKQGKYTSAIITSKVLGVDKVTLLSWLQTPLAIKVMDQEVDQYVARISSSKDWKASAYLLDKLHDQQDKDKTVDIQNIILIRK